MLSKQISTPGYKVVYEGVLLNCMAMRYTLPDNIEPIEENEPLYIEPKRIMVIVINAKSQIEIIDDVAEKFKFIPKQ